MLVMDLFHSQLITYGSFQLDVRLSSEMISFFDPVRIGKLMRICIYVEDNIIIFKQEAMGSQYSSPFLQQKDSNYTQFFINSFHRQLGRQLSQQDYLNDLLGIKVEKIPDSTRNSNSPLASPANPTAILTLPTSMPFNEFQGEKMDLEQNSSSNSTHQMPHITAEQLETRGKKKKKASKRPECYHKNITRDVVRKFAGTVLLDVNTSNTIQWQLKDLTNGYREFAKLMKEIERRETISNAHLFHLYLVPSASDRRLELKKIFTEHFMYYLDNYHTADALESSKVERLLTYISYNRRYLAYLKDTTSHRASRKHSRIPGIQKF